MKNRYVSFKCPSCMSNIQMKARSTKSEIFYCPVCESGEIENPESQVIVRVIKSRLPAEARVPVRIL